MLYSIPLSGALFSSLGFLLAYWFNTKKINYSVLVIVLLTFIIQVSSFLFLEPVNKEHSSPELDRTMEEIKKLEAEHHGTSSDDLLKKLSLLKQLSNNPYIDKKYNFKINLPEGWTLNNDNKQPYSMFLNKNRDATIIVSSMDNTNNATLDSVSSFIKNKPGFEFISEKKDLTSEQRLSVNIIDMRSSSDKGNIRSKALVFVSGNKKYVITITGNVFESSWDEYEDLIEFSELSLRVQ